MELKGFQKDVLGDLRRFLSILTEKENIKDAYSLIWEEKGVSVGAGGMPSYKTTIKGVPQVCLKVPTGGGKTFLAANSIKPVFESMPHVHPKAVVWLVPSDAILRQTVRALSDHDHPYRQRIDVDFGNRVEVYTKDQLLTAQNFSPVSVDENLSIFVLTYDSFRTSKKDGRKAYQQNGNLTAFPAFYGSKQALLPDTDETALIQVIRSLNPLIIVDESHHATSKLSVEMLENFNPCFVLELTATPKSGSNIISIVDARKLKKEEMVKLPVIVYNQKNQDDVFLSAIALRRRLEETAVKEEKNGGKYIRPIVLFQAQPRTNEDSTTYEKIKKSLIEIGVPDSYIAIKTGEKDEIKDTNLLSKECPIRYIITVNALKEGWDCPFAYILATIANRSSVVDVEQILGRILRMPYAKAGKNDHLNISYAITSSTDFYSTLERVVAGLVNAGFSKRDHRIIEPTEEPMVIPQDEKEQTEMILPSDSDITVNDADYDIPTINTDGIRSLLDAMDSSEVSDEDLSFSSGENNRTSLVDNMMAMASEENKVYWEQMDNSDESQSAQVPFEVRDKMNEFAIKKEFKSEADSLVIPQFMRDDGITYFSESGHQLLKREDLRSGFTLKNKDTMIDFGSVHAELARVDIDDGDEAVPRAFKLQGFANDEMREWFDSLPSEAKRRKCREIIIKRLSKIDSIGDAEIEDYVDRVMSNMSESELTELEQAPEMYAKRIQEKVEQLLAEHEKNSFQLMMQQDRIVCEPSFHLHETISPTKTISSIPKSLYEEEDGDLNDYEKKVIYEIAALDNIRWWHRNISRREFAINGAVTAYPDLIVRTESGKTLMIETKGDHLDNSESAAKAKTGAEWASQAGRLYKYFMVFQTKSPDYSGACSYDEFMEIVKDL